MKASKTRRMREAAETLACCASGAIISINSQRRFREMAKSDGRRMLYVRSEQKQKKREREGENVC